MALNAHHHPAPRTPLTVEWSTGGTPLCKRACTLRNVGDLATQEQISNNGLWKIVNRCFTPTFLSRWICILCTLKHISVRLSLSYPRWWPTQLHTIVLALLPSPFILLSSSLLFSGFTPSPPYKSLLLAQKSYSSLCFPEVKTTVNCSLVVPFFLFYHLFHCFPWMFSISRILAFWDVVDRVDKGRYYIPWILCCPSYTWVQEKIFLFLSLYFRNVIFSSIHFISLFPSEFLI